MEPRVVEGLPAGTLALELAHKAPHPLPHLTGRNGAGGRQVGPLPDPVEPTPVGHERSLHLSHAQPAPRRLPCGSLSRIGA